MISWIKIADEREIGCYSEVCISIGKLVFSSFSFSSCFFVFLYTMETFFSGHVCLGLCPFVSGCPFLSLGMWNMLLWFSRPCVCPSELSFYPCWAPRVLGLYPPLLFSLSVLCSICLLCPPSLKHLFSCWVKSLGNAFHCVFIWFIEFFCFQLCFPQISISLRISSPPPNFSSILQSFSFPSPYFFLF